jgi:signal peptidase II
MMSRRKKLLLVFLLGMLCVALDQTTKLWASRHLSASVSSPQMDGLIRFKYVENSGVFSSIGTELQDSLKHWLFSVGASLLLLILLLFILFHERTSKTLLAGSGMVIGGGLSNVIDRLLHQGVVIDYVYLVFGNWMTDIFNLADLAITMGLLLMMLASFTSSQQKNSSD